MKNRVNFRFLTKLDRWRKRLKRRETSTAWGRIIRKIRLYYFYRDYPGYEIVDEEGDKEDIYIY